MKEYKLGNINAAEKLFIKRFFRIYQRSSKIIIEDTNNRQNLKGLKVTNNKWEKINAAEKKFIKRISKNIKTKIFFINKNRAV